MATCSGATTATSSSNVSSYATSAFTPTAGALLVAFVFVSDSVVATSYTNSAGLTFSLVGSVAFNAGANRVHIFVSNGFATAVSQTCTFACTGDAGTGCAQHVTQVTGMSRSGLNAIRQSNFASANQAAGTPTPAFDSAVLTDNVALGAVGNLSNTSGLIAPSGWSQRANNGYNTPTTGFHVVNIDSGFTGTTVTWGNSSATAFGAALVELDTTTPAANINTLMKYQRTRRVA